MTFRLVLLPALLGLVLCATAQAQEATSLQQRMSPGEFKAAGLDKLSPTELRSLDAWLQAHEKTTTRVVTATGAPVFYPDTHKRSAFEAHLAGHFEGWSGHTAITLDNGQQWKQVGSDDILCNASDQPAAKVKPSLFGAWLMHVDGCNGSAHVERTR